jgi:hypothetical protein
MLCPGCNKSFADTKLVWSHLQAVEAEAFQAPGGRGKSFAVARDLVASLNYRNQSLLQRVPEGWLLTILVVNVNSVTGLSIPSM